MPRGEILGRTGHAVRSLEHLAAPRKGTQCALLSREVLVAASETDPAVHRLRFAWPSTFGGAPSCCEGADGVIHVHVRAPLTRAPTAATWPRKSSQASGVTGARSRTKS